MPPQKKWPEKRRLIGTKVPRVDGPAKATGTAKYSFDINRPGMLHAIVLRSPYAHAKVGDINTSAAEKMPGVKAIVTVAEIQGRPLEEVFYAGDEILAVAADTEEHARDAVHAIKIQFDKLDFFVKTEDALKNPTKGTTPGGSGGNVLPGGNRTNGDMEKGYQSADAIVEATYSVPVQTHVCLESHGLVAEWEGNNLTVWASTQAVPATADGLKAFYRNKKIEASVRCITHNMGGGYGSKFGADIQGYLATELARKAKAPVKLFLERADEHCAAGMRPSATAKVKIAGTKEGKITAFESESWGTPGIGRAAGVNIQVLPYVYAVANAKIANKVVRLNIGAARAMRAPGHPQNCFITEAALDDLAHKLKLDPLEMRLENLPKSDPVAKEKTPNVFTGLREELYTKQIEKIAEMCQWKKLWHPPGQGPTKGPVKHGIGMALHTWGAGNPNNDVRVTISSDGSVLVQCSTQDLGVGARTVLPIIVADVLGLEVKDVKSEIGESQFGRSTPSGGSTTTPGISPAALNAGCAARDALFTIVAQRLGTTPENLAIDPEKPGQVQDKANNKSYAWKEVCAKLGMDKVQESGNFTPGLSEQGVGGVQVAEVLADTETGVVRCTRFWAVQDCGLIINKLGCESQVCGGIIMGLNYAMFEDQIMDRHTGRMVNPDMEFYKLGGIRDMPEIAVYMMDMPQRGVIGIGEPPTVGTAAAIGNAICNAIGVRVPAAPFTPDKVLGMLSKQA